MCNIAYFLVKLEPSSEIRAVNEQQSKVPCLTQTNCLHDLHRQQTDHTHSVSHVYDHTYQGPDTHIHSHTRAAPFTLLTHHDIATLIISLHTDFYIGPYTHTSTITHARDVHVMLYVSWLVCQKNQSQNS